LSVLTLVGKPGCHLCDEMRAVVERVLRGTALELLELNVESHPDLEARYVFEIPVLLLEGQEIARHRTTEDELRERLRKALAS
jgi:Glutaredoxin-like domain (DUF836)